MFGQKCLSLEYINLRILLEIGIYFWETTESIFMDRIEAQRFWPRYLATLSLIIKRLFEILM